MRSKKFIAAILSFAMIFTSIQFPPIQVKAEEAVITEIDPAILARNATANSEQNPEHSTDGPAAWAFDDDQNRWWHSRWRHHF